MSPTIRGAFKHAVFLGFVSVALLSAAALGGGGCPPADAAASTRKARLVSAQGGGVPAERHGLASSSNAKMRFQSSFMLMTVQPFFCASSYSACGNVPTLVSGRPFAGP